MTRGNGLTSNLLRGIPTRSFGPTLLRDETVFQKVFCSSTSSTDIALSRFFATCITYRMFCWAIADEMTRLYVGRKFPGPAESGDTDSTADFTNISLGWFRTFGAVGDEVLTARWSNRRPAAEDYEQRLTSVPSQRLHLYPGGGFPGSPKPLSQPRRTRLRTVTCLCGSVLRGPFGYPIGSFHLHSCPADASVAVAQTR